MTVHARTAGGKSSRWEGGRKLKGEGRKQGPEVAEMKPDPCAGGRTIEDCKISAGEDTALDDERAS